jgi:hypothetical protein
VTTVSKTGLKKLLYRCPMADYKDADFSPGIDDTFFRATDDLNRMDAERRELRALLADFQSSRFGGGSAGPIPVLERVARFFETGRACPDLWRPLATSQFFGILEIDLDCIDTDPQYRVAIFHCLMSLFLAAERLGNQRDCSAFTESSIFLYICRFCPRHSNYFGSLDPLAVISTLMCVRDSSFANVLKFVCSWSGCMLIDHPLVVTDRTLGFVPRAITNFLNGTHIKWQNRFYQPDVWFYRMFIGLELHHQRDADRFPLEAQLPFSVAAIAALGGWYKPGTCYNPIPALLTLPPTLIRCFALALPEAGFELKRAGMILLINLMENVWPVASLASLASDLDSLIPHFIAWLAEACNPLSEVAARFLRLLINGHLVWDDAICFDWIPDEGDRAIACGVALDHPEQAVRLEALNSVLQYLDQTIGADSEVYRNTLPGREWVSSLTHLVPGCAEILGEAPQDMKCATMRVIIKLLQHVWLAEPRAALRHILVSLAPGIVSLISTDRGPLLEACLQFFVLFLGKGVYTQEDASEFEWLEDLNDIGQDERTACHLALVRYWARDMPSTSPADCCGCCI